MSSDFYIHLVEKRAKWDPNGGVWFAWARSVLGGLASSQRRQRNTEKRYLQASAERLRAESDHNPVASDLFDRFELKLDLEESLQQLDQHDPQLGKAFRLWHIAGRTLEQTAKLCDCKVGELRGRLQQARDFLRKTLQAKGYGPSS